MGKSLEQVLADWRGDAAVLRRQGHHSQADQLEKAADQVQEAAHDYLKFLPEDEARLYSGRALAWLRAQFPAWETAGHARKDGRRRSYRMLVLPRRADPVKAYQAGRDAA